MNFTNCESYNNNLRIKTLTSDFTTFCAGITANSKHDNFENCISVNNTIQITSNNYDSFSGGFVSYYEGGGTFRDCISSNNTIISMVGPASSQIFASSSGFIALTDDIFFMNCTSSHNTITADSTETSK